MNISMSEVNASDLQTCLDVIHQSFRTVADQFGLTKEKLPEAHEFYPTLFS